MEDERGVSNRAQAAQKEITAHAFLVTAISAASVGELAVGTGGDVVSWCELLQLREQ